MEPSSPSHIIEAMTCEVMESMTPSCDEREPKEVLMNIRLAALILVAVPFAVLSTVATVQHGYTGIFAVAWSSTAGAQVFADLGIALTLLCGFLIPDARARGLMVWPWLLAMPLIGSFAPLGYLLWRQLRASNAEPRRVE